MAAKKKAKKKTGKALTTGWQQQLAVHAKEGKAPKEKALTGDYIAAKNGKFMLGNVKLGTELDCVVIAYNFEKVYYDADYVEGEAQSPACAALSYDEDEMVISEGVPNQQCEDCTECWANEWESAKVGKGKACADRRRLALVVAGKDDKMELKILNIPPTSLKSWKGFVNEVDALGLNVMQCAVNISFDEDSTAAQMPLVFEFVDEVKNEKALNVTAAMLEPAYKLIEQPYDFSNYDKGGKGKKSKKKTSKKKTAKKKSKKKSKFS